MQAYTLLAKSLPGAAKNRVLRAELAGQIAEVIWAQWQVGIWQWKLKHVEWYLDVQMRDAANWTRYHHWSAIRAILLAIGRSDLVDRLAKRKNASYLRPTGEAGALGVGRPQKVVVRKPTIRS